jgi:glycosyltransferase involved in cell wall biosynthesis
MDIVLAKLLRPYGPVIFDWTEDWAVYHNATTLDSEQTASIRMASGIIVVTKRLAERAQKLSNDNQNILFLPNATAWEPEVNYQCPEDMKHIPFPRIGYLGHLGPWFDKDLVFSLSRARPEWHWVMVGHADEKLKKFFRNCNNIHLLGRRPFVRLQSYMSQCQVLAAPYVKNVEGDSSKIYDYLTLGYPIICTEMETSRRLQPNVRLASEQQSWLNAIEESLAENDPYARKARQKISLENTWDQRASVLLNWLRDLNHIPEEKKRRIESPGLKSDRTP